MNEKKPTKIKLVANPPNAPGCVLVQATDDRSVLVQTDWDFPATATAFGFSLSRVKNPSRPECEHTDTDGTINCPECDLHPGEFVAAARHWIDAHDGAEAADPGYFAPPEHS